MAAAPSHRHWLSKISEQSISPMCWAPLKIVRQGTRVALNLEGESIMRRFTLAMLFGLGLVGQGSMAGPLQAGQQASEAEAAAALRQLGGKLELDEGRVIGASLDISRAGDAALEHLAK